MLVVVLAGSVGVRVDGTACELCEGQLLLLRKAPADVSETP